jgi:hypothetical protein
MRCRAFVLLTLGLVFSVHSFSQQTLGRTCAFNEIHQKEGWEIPGLDRAKPIGRRGAFPYIPGGQVTLLSPGKSEATFTYYSCDKSRLDVTNTPIAVLQLYRYDIEGRVFAYYVKFLKQRFVDGKRSDAGSVTSVFFYDVDGSGKFVLLMTALSPMPELIPDWAKSKTH